MTSDRSPAAQHSTAYCSTSWLGHLRQHERVRLADKAMQDHVNAFHTGDGRPVMTHLIASDH